MNSKFNNLPQNYKEILDEIKTILDGEIITKISNNSIPYYEINALFEVINKICLKYECNSYDINKMINGYSKKNSVIDVIKKIATLRNKYIVTTAFKLPIWKENMILIKNTIETKINKKQTIKNVEEIFLQLLKKYKYEWDGLWSLIETNKFGEPIKINVFDIDDFDFIVNKLNNN